MILGVYSVVVVDRRRVDTRVATHILYSTKLYTTMILVNSSAPSTMRSIHYDYNDSSSSGSSSSGSSIYYIIISSTICNSIYALLS